MMGGLAVMRRMGFARSRIATVHASRLGNLSTGRAVGQMMSASPPRQRRRISLVTLCNNSVVSGCWTCKNKYFELLARLLIRERLKVFAIALPARYRHESMRTDSQCSKPGAIRKHDDQAKTFQIYLLRFPTDLAEARSGPREARF